MIKLTEIEENEIKELLESMEVGSHVKTGGLMYLLKKWGSFVQKSEDGYSLTYSDYTNDLSTRGIIQRLINNLLDKDLAKKISSYLEPFDKKFKKLLVDTNTEAFPSEGKHEWWFWGIVKNAKGELLEDLTDEKGSIHFLYYLR